MRFTVTFEAGIYHFLVESVDGVDNFVEEFELSDVNEAKEAVWELVDEIAGTSDDEGDDFVSDLFRDGG